MATRQRSEVDRPTLYSAATSPTAVMNLTASLLVLCCLCLPNRMNPSGRAPNRQLVVQQALNSIVDDRSDLLLTIFLWPYLFAGITLSVFVMLIIARPRWFEKAVFVPSCASLCALTVGWFALLFGGADESRAARWIAVILIPTAAVVGMHVMSLVQSGKRIVAAQWCQGLLCVWAVFSLRWFWLPRIDQPLWTGVLSITAVMLMMFASWTWDIRGEYDLVDRNQVHQRYQLSIKQIIFAITLVAIGLAYWQAIGSQSS